MTDDLTTRTVAQLRDPIAMVLFQHGLLKDEEDKLAELCRRAEANAALRDLDASINKALAAAPKPAAAPVAPDREAAIKAWCGKVFVNKECSGNGYTWDSQSESAWVMSDATMREAVALMRSAPAPDRGDALRELRAELEQSRAYSESRRAEHLLGSGSHEYWNGCAEADATWLRRVDALLAAPQPPAPAAPRADDGVDEAIGDLTLTMLNHDLAPNFCSDLSRVLRRLAAAARRGGQ